MPANKLTNKLAKINAGTITTICIAGLKNIWLILLFVLSIRTNAGLTRRPWRVAVEAQVSFYRICFVSLLKVGFKFDHIGPSEKTMIWKSFFENHNC